MGCTLAISLIAIFVMSLISSQIAWSYRPHIYDLESGTFIDIPSFSIMHVECNTSKVPRNPLQLVPGNITLLVGQNVRVACGEIVFPTVDFILETGQAVEVSCNDITAGASIPNGLTPAPMSLNTTVMIRCGI
jgi:hypothetical protein